MEMRAHFSAAVEEITGRKVIQSTMSMTASGSSARTIGLPARFG
jgi:hypothetical protein